MFKKNQKVIYTVGIWGSNHVEAEIMDPGSTQTSILIFHKNYDNGRPNILTVDNDEIVDKETYFAIKRESKINQILNEMDITNNIINYF